MWYWLFRIVCLIILKIFFRLKVKGIENLPKKSNFIVVANHSSFLDPFIIGVAIPRRIHWISLRDIYNNFWLKWFIVITGAIPTGSASEKTISLLKKGNNIGLFPEGTRTHNGKLKEFRKGASVIALRTGRPIVPCAILGAFQAFPRGAKFPKFSPITVKIEKPIFLLKEFCDIIDEGCVQEGIFKIRNAIQEMINAG